MISLYFSVTLFKKSLSEKSEDECKLIALQPIEQMLYCQYNTKKNNTFYPW